MRDPEDTKYVWDKENFKIVQKSIMKIPITIKTIGPDDFKPVYRREYTCYRQFLSIELLMLYAKYSLKH
jgi:hypothetical protein